MKTRPTGALWFGCGFFVTLFIFGVYTIYFTDAYAAATSSFAALRQMTVVTMFAWLLAAATFTAGALVMRRSPTPMRAAIAGSIVALLTAYINYPIMFLQVPTHHAGWVSALIVGLACFFSAILASLGSPPKEGAVV